MFSSFERRMLRAVQVFDLVDALARDRGVNGPFPRPIGEIRFYLIGREENGTTQLYDPPLKMTMQMNPSGYHLFFGQVQNRESRKINLITPVADGDGASQVKYKVRIESQYYQIEEFSFPPESTNGGGQSAITKLLEPSLTYPFPTTPRLGATVLRGMMVDKETGLGMPDVVIKVEQITADPPTNQLILETTSDSTGQWLKRVANEVMTKKVHVQYSLQGTVLFEDEVSLAIDAQSYLLLEKRPPQNGGAATYHFSSRRL